MSWFFPKERKLNNRDLEAYAQACYDIWEMLEDGQLGLGHHKMYDPLTIEGKVAHSYVFDLEDGGRHHSFKDLWHLRDAILWETVERIKQLVKENEQTPQA